MPSPATRSNAWTASTLLLGALLLTACKPASEELAGATSEPASAVRQLAEHTRHNDLVGYARDAVPPAHYAALETAWREDRSRWPLTELPLNDKFVPMVALLSAPQAEARLQQVFRRQFAGQGKELKDAARSLGLFGVQFVRKEGDYSNEERQHYAQVIAALSEWAQQAPLSDRALAKNTINGLTAAARKTGLKSEEDFRLAGMTGSLQRLPPLFAELKASFNRYGLSFDSSLAELRTGLVEQQGEHATVRIHYPLGEKEIDALVQMERVDGKWYLSEYLRHAEQFLPATAPANTAASTPGESAQSQPAQATGEPAPVPAPSR